MLLKNVAIFVPAANNIVTLQIEFSTKYLMTTCMIFWQERLWYRSTTRVSHWN